MILVLVVVVLVAALFALLGRGSHMAGTEWDPLFGRWAPESSMPALSG